MDLNFIEGSIPVSTFLVFVTFCTKEEGKPILNRTDHRSFFSLEIAEGFVTKLFACL